MKLERMTLAATNLEAMAAFYDGVFDTGLFRIEGQPMYIGMLAGVELLLCSNTIAQVEARQNRLQLRLRVASIDALLPQVTALGGAIINDGADENGRVVGISDPDGNTLELAQSFS